MNEFHQFAEQCAAYGVLITQYLHEDRFTMNASGRTLSVTQHCNRWFEVAEISDEGQSVEMYCDADGNPTSVDSWNALLANSLAYSTWRTVEH
jgi:YD repeat-containing protein